MQNTLNKTIGHAPGKMEDTDMTMLEMMLVLCFGVPVAVLCCLFVVLAGMMMMADQGVEVAANQN